MEIGIGNLKKVMAKKLCLMNLSIWYKCNFYSIFEEHTIQLLSKRVYKCTLKVYFINSFD